MIEVAEKICNVILSCGWIIGTLIIVIEVRRYK